jgi:predicted nucleotidyltransferase
MIVILAWRKQTRAGLLDHFLRTIVERFRPRRVILFGSHARGEAQPDCDLYVFVKMETKALRPERLRTQRGAGRDESSWRGKLVPTSIPA